MDEEAVTYAKQHISDEILKMCNREVIVELFRKRTCDCGKEFRMCNNFRAQCPLRTHIQKYDCFKRKWLCCDKPELESKGCLPSCHYDQGTLSWGNREIHERVVWVPRILIQGTYSIQDTVWNAFNKKPMEILDKLILPTEEKTTVEVPIAMFFHGV
jgi:hypothetical protein